jgi:hypothetical protein
MNVATHEVACYMINKRVATMKQLYCLNKKYSLFICPILKTLPTNMTIHFLHELGRTPVLD